MAYTLKIKMMNVSEQVSSYYKDFKSHHEGDSGIDLICPEQLIVSKNIIGTIDFKIQCEMRDKDNNLVSYYLYPRSSISKTPFMMANSVGIIDAGYRGNIMAKIRSFGNEFEVISEGTKLFQICAPNLGHVKVEIVDELSETSRGSGGFGSTNK
jgi:dUTP pyrophosphatase